MSCFCEVYKGVKMGEVEVPKNLLEERKIIHTYPLVRVRIIHVENCRFFFLVLIVVNNEFIIKQWRNILRE